MDTREKLYDEVEARSQAADVRAKIRALRAQKLALIEAKEDADHARDAAYTERNRLVALLASIFPSWRTRHPDSDTAWQDDWRTIIGVQLPSGQCTWHVHDSEVGLFQHVREHDVPWDGHTTERKYARVAAAIPGYTDLGRIHGQHFQELVIAEFNSARAQFASDRDLDPQISEPILDAVHELGQRIMQRVRDEFGG